MTQKRDRFFAAFGAALFLVTASALTITVIYSAISAKNDSSKTSTSTADSKTKAKTCEDNLAEPVLSVPDIYKSDTKFATLGTTDLEAGTGQAAKDGDCLVMKYYGTLASNGTMFDENFTKTTAFAFTLGQGQVITGWDKGLVGMKVGGTRRLDIPAADGYGAQGSGAIPANADIVFTVKLLRIQAL